MQIIPLYKYERPEGGITVSPVKPEDTEFTEEMRLVTEEGKSLVKDGVKPCQCIDVETVDGWHEIDTPEFEK